MQGVERTVAAVERACRTSASADELLEAVSAEMHRAVPHDSALWVGVDPVTMLATAPSRVENLDPALCDTFWHLEFHEQDTALYTDLARDGGVSALRLSLDGRPNRSIRFREFLAPQRLDDELRATLRAGTSVWGFLGLYREQGRPAFDECDLSVVQAVSELVACALRGHVRDAAPWLTPSAPGLLVVDRNGRAVSSNDEAREWLAELWPGGSTGSIGGAEPLDINHLRDAAMGVATALYAVVARARAVAEGRERASARLRLRDNRGRWVVLHASPLTSHGESGAETVAVVIEAAKSAEIAPIIIEAYSLTPRERDVLAALARGNTNAEIAAELFLSPHTVRDYIKTVFEKFGVSSRGELVARLYGEHYSDTLHDTMVHIS